MYQTQQQYLKKILQKKLQQTDSNIVCLIEGDIKIHSMNRKEMTQIAQFIPHKNRF